ncbi:MAG: hypothetical protein AAF545_06475 [Pseudomonadota bacterium]
MIFRELAKDEGGIGFAGLGALLAPRLEPGGLISWVRTPLQAGYRSVEDGDALSG